MKFIAYIYRLFVLLAILLVTSCSHNEELQVVPDSNADKVHFTIGVSLPGVSTTDSRAFGGEGNTDGTGSGGYFEFSDLYVAVFVEIDGISYLEEFVKAESTVPTWNSEGYWEFGVELTKTDGPRRLHLIANYPDLMLGFGEEGELIGRLLANGADHDVYWNYRNLARIDDGFEKELRNVPLIRNYVQIRLNQTANFDNFILDQYALYNVPTKGTVAPYNPSNTSNKFANFVVDGNDGIKCQSYSYMLNNEKYKGNEPFDDGSFLDKNVSQLDWKEPDEPTYIYERNHSNTNEPTCMLIKGRYVENGEPTLETPPTYYKLDFVYDETDTNSKAYYNLLRNFIYTMNVNSVTGPGYNSIEEALKQPASNNIGGDAVAKDYTNISDGIGRLFVSSTYILFTKQKTVDLYYKYIPDIVEAPNTTDNGSVTITPQTGEVLNNPSNPMTGTAVTEGQYNGWNKVQLVSNEVQTESKSQHIIFAAGNLQREVELILRSPYTLDVDVLQDKVATQPKQPVTIEIELPGGIEQLLPLRLFISSQDNTIYPDYGTNIPAESQNGKYGFIKEVSLLEYQNSNTITCNFRTNCADNATTVYVDNEYFNRGTDNFENLNMSISFSDEAKRYGSGQTFTMTFETDRTGVYSLSGNLDFVSVSGNGASLNVENKKLTVTAGGTYTITCRTKTWADAANVTITSDTDNSYSVIGIGDKRNVLFIKPNSITGANIQYNTDIRISSESEITSSNWDNTTEIGTRNNLINNGYSYVVENLDADDVFYLGYRRSNYGSYTYYNSQELKASELAGTGLNIQCSSN
ncbi:MAG: hypothetical protein IJB61_02295 [Bacteroides sp]|nr:hypothetical protein [Bacteroides sp.]